MKFILKALKWKSIVIAMASSAMDAAVDIIRRKIYGLKKEAVQEVAKVEELENVTKESNEAATENEKKLRELMKVIQ